MATLTDDLGTWTEPLSVEEFFRDHWLRKPFHSPANDPAERLRWLASVLGPFELPSLIKHAGDKVAVWYTEGDALRTELKVDPPTAATLYRAGLTLYFHLNLHPTGPALIDRLCRQLGQTTSRQAHHSVFATRRGRRTLPHIDERENFTIQLTGHKRWRCAYNPLWRLPLADWEPGMRSGELLPDDALTFDLLPGSMLYVPGTWVHTTEDLADSLSMNVSLRAQTWADVLIPLVKQYLTVNHGWDAPAARLLSEEGPTEDDLVELRARLDDLARLPPSELALIGSEEEGDDSTDVRYRRNPLKRAWLRTRDKEFLLQVEGPNSALAAWTIPDDQIHVYQWLARAAQPFALEDVRTLFAQVGLPVLRGIVTRLLDSGFIIPE